MSIDAAYNRFVTLTGHETAAAILVLAEAIGAPAEQATLTPKQAAAHIGVSARTIYDLCHSGRLRHQRIGRAVRIKRDDLDRYNSDTIAEPVALRCLKPA